MDSKRSEARRKFRSSFVLTRVVNGRTRYYKIICQPTLFGEYVVVREYGSVHNRKATGQITQYFQSAEKAFETVISLLSQKRRKGYV
ncbi:WGR domain-containing protein [Hydrogenimonas cancrithermarum]|uniref:WGR domain-containing protein n=1 Tax=Hydrogenimonas cancrithermarum TaxID=2993563 RepID=UPI0025740007|nr:WGR domain-containing protein [Hydrogenimonas cancrithermarum]